MRLDTRQFCRKFSNGLAVTLSVSLLFGLNSAHGETTGGAVQGAELPGGNTRIFKDRILAWAPPETPSAKPSTLARTLQVPVESLRFSSYFGVRADPFDGRRATHAGVDIPGAAGTPILASAAGTVTVARRSAGYGYMVELDHGQGVRTRYGHLSQILVSENMTVDRGAVVALMGSTGRSTGNHLHFEVRTHGQPVDPQPYLSGLLSIAPSPADQPVAPFISAFARARLAAAKPMLSLPASGGQ